MSLAENLYRSAPPPLQTLLVSAKGLQFAIERYGGEYQSYKQRLPELVTPARSALLDYQLLRLKDFLGFAQRHSPYYRRQLAGFDPKSIRSLEDLQALPTLEKEALRSHSDEVYTVGPGQAIEGHTGGTTGKSLVVRFTKEDFQRRMANLDFFRELHRTNHRMRRATFSGKHLVQGDGSGQPLWRTNLVLRQRFYSTFHMREENLSRYIDDLNKFKPQIIDGFVSCIVDLCTYARATGQSFHFQPRGIFPTSEPLFPHQRKIIRDALGVEPRDQYASSEGAPFIVECPRGRLHFWTHTGVIEIDEAGDALVTSFDTHGTPLIRYRIGDRVVFAPEAERCPCGWESPLVERIEGREIDYLFSEERGKVYSPNIANVVKNLPNAVIKSQFVQVSEREVLVKLVVDPAKYDSEAHADIIRDEVGQKLGRRLEVGVEVVPDIPRAASGKHRLIINEVV